MKCQKIPGGWGSGNQIKTYTREGSKGGTVEVEIWKNNEGQLVRIKRVHKWNGQTCREDVYNTPEEKVSFLVVLYEEYGYLNDLLSFLMPVVENPKVPTPNDPEVLRSTVNLLDRGG